MEINLYCRFEILFTIVLINFRPRAQCFTLSVRPINDVELEFLLETNDETNDRAHRCGVKALCESTSSLDLLEDNLIYPSCFHVFVHLCGGGCRLDDVGARTLQILASFALSVQSPTIPPLKMALRTLLETTT